MNPACIIEQFCFERGLKCPLAEQCKKEYRQNCLAKRNMIEIKATSILQGQPVEAIYRFDNKIIYVKVNNEQMLQKFLQQIIDKGGKVKKGRNWIQIDMFGEHKKAKIGEKELHLDAGKEEIETTMTNFFLKKLEEAGFQTSVKEI